MRFTLYAGRRLIFLLPQLLLISFTTFVLVRLLPGDPARLPWSPSRTRHNLLLLADHAKNCVNCACRSPKS
jgi:ABC-type dipeptide/oligopeptide/nickel transport system permease component